MSDEKLTPLDDDLRALLNRTTSGTARIPDDAKARVWTRLESVVSPPVPPPSSSRWSAVSKIALGMAIYGAGFLSGALLLREDSREAASQHEVSSSSVVESVVVPVLPLDAGLDGDVAPPIVEPAVEPVLRAPAEKGASMARDSDAQQERLLVERARSALARGDATEALEVLRRHRARHPRGQLREERDALMVQALVNVGRMEDARAEALRFQRAFPQSLFTSIVERAVRTRADEAAPIP